MQAGRLRHRIIVDEPVTSQADNGEEIVTWRKADTVWGAISPLHGRELLQASAIAADLDTRITIRWSPRTDQINPKWRLRHGALIYNIKSVAHIDLRQRQIELLVNSGRNQG